MEEFILYPRLLEDSKSISWCASHIAIEHKIIAYESFWNSRTVNTSFVRHFSSDKEHRLISFTVRFVTHQSLLATLHIAPLQYAKSD